MSITEPRGANQRVGAAGEELAAGWLAEHGYTVLERNFRIRGGEVDIVARLRETIVFVEVKTRRTSTYGLPQLAVTPFKQRQIARAARFWLARHKQENSPARFDVIAILLNSSGLPFIDHIQDAFDLPD